MRELPIIDDTPKHKKKKPSSDSKSSKKADHKHAYELVIAAVPMESGNTYYIVKNYCPICGASRYATGLPNYHWFQHHDLESLQAKFPNLKTQAVGP